MDIYWIFIFIIFSIFIGIFCFNWGVRTIIPIKNGKELLKKETNELVAETTKLIKKKTALVSELEQLNQSMDDILDENNVLIHQNTELKNKFKQLSNQLNIVSAKEQILREKNQEVEDFIAKSEQLAKEKADSVYQNELLKKQNEYNRLSSIAEEEIEKYSQQIKEMSEELESIKRTRIAVIQANKQEEKIKENKEDFCLIVSPAEHGDIEQLRAVAKKITKSRAVYMAIWNAYYQPIAKKKINQILGKSDACGIYKITNQETGECYIGQSTSIRKRWMDHMKMLLQIDAPAGNKLYAAGLDYDLDSFSFELLEECKPQELNDKEKYFIELYQSNIYGYNILSGNKGDK